MKSVINYQGVSYMLNKFETIDEVKIVAPGYKKFIRSLKRALDRLSEEEKICFPFDINNLKNDVTFEEIKSISEKLNWSYNKTIYKMNQVMAKVDGYMILDGYTLEYPDLFYGKNRWISEQFDEATADEYKKVMGRTRDAHRRKRCDITKKHEEQKILSPKFEGLLGKKEVNVTREELYTFEHLEHFVLKNSELSDAQLYNECTRLCKENNIPAELAEQTIFSIIRLIRKDEMKPIILVGHAGVGKTFFGHIMSELTGLPIYLVFAPNKMRSNGLCGCSLTWQSPRFGEVAAAMCKTGCDNPIFFIDEIDKAIGSPSRQGGMNIQDDLLSMCDKTRMIHDNFMDTDISTKHMPIIMTCNSLEPISEFLLDRCDVIHFPDPDISRISKITEKFIADELESFSIDSSRMTIDDDAKIRAIKELRNGKGVVSLRKYETLIDEAIKNAYREMMHGDHDHITVTDSHFREAIDFLDDGARNRVGFL